MDYAPRGLCGRDGRAAEMFGQNRIYLFGMGSVKDADRESEDLSCGAAESGGVAHAG